MACLADRYPAKFQADVRSIAGKCMQMLFLQRSDLERGYRKIANGAGGMSRLTISDVFALPRKRRPRKRKEQGKRWIGYSQNGGTSPESSHHGGGRSQGAVRIGPYRNTPGTYRRAYATFTTWPQTLP